MKFELVGKLKGGKNAVQTTRSGRRYPNPAFVTWRNEMLRQVADQLEPASLLVTPARLTVYYYHGDNLRRDVDNLLGGLFHLLERAGLVKDDTLIKEVHWEPMGLDRKNPRATVILEAI